MLAPTSNSIIGMLNRGPTPSSNKPQLPGTPLIAKRGSSKPRVEAVAAPSAGKVKLERKYPWLYNTKARATSALSEAKNKKETKSKGLIEPKLLVNPNAQHQSSGAMLGLTYTANNVEWHDRLNARSQLSAEDKAEARSSESLKKVSNKQAQRKYDEFMQRDQLKKCRVNLIKQLLDDNLRLKTLQKQNVISKNREFYSKSK